MIQMTAVAALMTGAAMVYALGATSENRFETINGTLTLEPARIPATPPSPKPVSPPWPVRG